MSAWEGFFAARDIWRDPLIASVLAGALCGFLGIYVVLRRTVFVSAALTQLSTLGIIAALILEESLGVEAEHAGVQLAVALIFSVAGALVLGMALHGRRLPGEASVGVSYVLAGALVVLGANRLVHAAHDLNAMVFGNAVAVPVSTWLCWRSWRLCARWCTRSSRRNSSSSRSTVRPPRHSVSTPGSGTACSF